LEFGGVMMMRRVISFLGVFSISVSQPVFPPGIDAIMELLRDKQRAAAQPDPEVEAASVAALKKVAAADLEHAIVSQAVGDDLAQVGPAEAVSDDLAHECR
jgi:hypothetical protein